MTPRGAAVPPNSVDHDRERLPAQIRTATAMTLAAAAQAVAWGAAIRAETVARVASGLRQVPSTVRAVVWTTLSAVGRAVASIATVRWD